MGTYQDATGSLEYQDAQASPFGFFLHLFCSHRRISRATDRTGVPNSTDKEELYCLLRLLAHSNSLSLCLHQQDEHKFPNDRLQASATCPLLFHRCIKHHSCNQLIYYKKIACKPTIGKYLFMKHNVAR